ncbi:MAG: DUF2975 domain-containing protein [Propionicimonas sp.]
MTRITIVVLRGLLALILAGGLVGQFWILPAWSDQLAVVYPEVAWLRWPLLLVAWLMILVVQAALVAVWVLLGMVQQDRVFTIAAFRWVDLLIAAAVIDTLLVLGVFVLCSFVLRANPAGLMLTELALVLGGAAFALLMVVMKGLLRQASQLTDELSVVI